jgi:CRP-like cAMP-binding protein
MPTPHALDGLIRKLEQHTLLDDGDRRAIRDMQYTARTLDAGTYLVREGDQPEYCCMILSGFAYRHKVTGDGARQIIAIHMTGDFVDLQNSYLEVSDHNVQALTRSEIGFVPRGVIRDMTARLPNLNRAFWTDTLVDASVFREWVMNVGRRASVTRIAHLLCEFALRLEAAGLAKSDHSYELPMTQEQIADAVGLTPVHVNRVLQELGRMGLIEREKRLVQIPDWERLRQIGDFSARYLHMDQGSTPPPNGGSLNL